MDVYLADDELMARILLRDLLAEAGSRFNVDITGEAENGEALLALIKEKRPDLVFVDIRMPLCDGLEVIRVANRRSPGIQWVIVSGYTEFEYAKKAVRLGVIDYLVKPVEPVDLVRILETAKATLEARSRDENARWEQAFFEKLSTDPEFENFDGSLCGEDGRIILCRIDLMGEVNAEHESRLLDRLRDGMSVYRRGDDRVVAVPLNPATVLLVCVTEPWKSIPTRAKAVKRAVTMILRDTFGEEEKVRWTLCAEGFVPPEGIRGAFGRMKRRSRLRFTLGLNTEIPDVAGEDLEEALAEIGTCVESIADGLLTEDRLPRNEEIKRIPDLIGRLPERERHGAFVGIRSYLAFRIAGNRSEIDAASDPAELANRLGQLADAIRSVAIGKNTGDRILEYVKRHFREDIGVNTVADRFDLTPSYVSSLFKKKTGVTFVRYLAELRIREAKDLLKNRPDLPLRDVSARLGYSNPRYFSKLFHRYTGVHPSDFRRYG